MFWLLVVHTSAGPVLPCSLQAHSLQRCRCRQGDVLLGGGKNNYSFLLYENISSSKNSTLKSVVFGVEVATHNWSENSIFCVHMVTHGHKLCCILTSFATNNNKSPIQDLQESPCNLILLTVRREEKQH